MFVEIYGAKFVNKGAELMLLAIKEKVLSKYPHAKIVLSCSSKAEWRELEKRGFKKKLTFRKNRFLWKDLGVFIPKSLRRKYGIVLNREIDVVFEASGFAYGDQWTPRLAHFVSSFSLEWKKNNAKIIFMPQAFGPFNNKQNYEYTRKALKLADLIYARDSVSLNYLRSLELAREIHQSPDFTMILSGVSNSKYEKLRNKACIIPNNKVISTSNDENISQKYIEYFRNVISYFRQQKIEPFVLIHEGIQDYQLGEKIIENQDGVELVWEKDPIVIKGIIANSRVVAGSRFHGLVSALSQGVPSCAIGWSHKYEMLFADFGLENGVLSLELSKEETFSRLDGLFANESYNQTRVLILVRAKELKSMVHEMWNHIFNLIDSIKSFK